MSILFAPVVAALALTAGKTDVVIDGEAPKTVLLAAEEMTNFLSRVHGQAVPIVNEPRAGRTPVVLGVNAWTRAAGLDPSALPRDSFQIRVTDDGVFIAGVDDPKADLREIVEHRGMVGLYILEGTGQRGTLFGVYDFLERVAGVRFYFPGELGTIVPRRATLSAATGERCVTPAFLIRRPYLPKDGRWPGETDDNLSRNTPKCWTWLRQRFSTCRIQCVHGQNQMRLSERFAKTRPEYFALLKDGRRSCDPGVTGEHLKNMICQSSAVWDEIFEDAKAYFSGQPASARGVPDIRRKGRFAWGANASGKVFDVMPDDGISQCWCAACQAAYGKSPSAKDYATDLLWGQTAKVARRLIDEKIPGDLTMMAYPPYRTVPTVDLPTNILVMVAEEGPWSNASEIDEQEAEVVAWNRKVNRTVWMWTYPGKHLRKTILGIPESTPRAYGRYFKRFAPHIFGAFCESGSDSSIFNYLNYYVFSRVAWDANVDVDAVLDEHHRLMYGAAAPEMGRFFDIVEEKWLNGIVGRFVETEDGTKIRHYASELEIFRETYTPSVLADLRRLFDAALAKVPAGSLEARRVAFVREEFLGPVERKAAAFYAMCDVKAEQARRAAAAGRALPMTGVWQPPRGVGLSVAEDRDVRLADEFSRRFEKKVKKGYGGDWGRIAYCFPKEGEGALVPGRRYRMSCFLKMKGVRPLNRPQYHSFSGGLRISVSGHANRPASRISPNYYIGDSDWMAHSVEFTCDPDRKELSPAVEISFCAADGTVWVEGLRVEEVEPSAAGEPAPRG